MTNGIDSQALDELLARAQLHEQLKNAPDLTLTADQAAFYLGVHPKKLERWRGEKLPPYPASMNAEGRSGVQVLYTVGALNDFIRSSQQEPAPVDASGMTSTRVINGKRVKPGTMSWIGSESVDSDSLDEPFFMNTNGTTISHCWDEDVGTVAERLRASTPIQWMTWNKALAGVWQDDRLRLAWLRHADAVAPGLRDAVDALRKQNLSQM
jgi:hypothetical protein